MLILGFIYSVSISWNINGISHNFIHNPYFRSPLLNRLLSILESITVGFSQIFYECIHMQHHKGNADRPDEHGETIDWISIYKHGHEGEAEHPFKYTFFSFFREDPKTVFKELKRKNAREAFWGIFELASFVTTFVILGTLNWHYICFLLPFYYFGHCLSYLNGYYRHYGGNPDEPIAWGVSTYDKLYNWTWFYNGYHAEHHFRPKVHWTRMQAFRDQIVDQQRAAGVRVIKPPHALGFLDPDLPPVHRPLRRRRLRRPRLESEPAS
jgi:fatty acid desaturase